MCYGTASRCCHAENGCGAGHLGAGPRKELLTEGIRPGCVLRMTYFTWQVVQTALEAFEMRRKVSPAVVLFGPAWPVLTCGSWQLAHSTMGRWCFHAASFIASRSSKSGAQSTTRSA